MHLPLLQEKRTANGERRTIKKERVELVELVSRFWGEERSKNRCRWRRRGNECCS